MLTDAQKRNRIICLVLLPFIFPSCEGSKRWQDETFKTDPCEGKTAANTTKNKFILFVPDLFPPAATSFVQLNGNLQGPGYDNPEPFSIRLKRRGSDQTAVANSFTEVEVRLSKNSGNSQRFFQGELAKDGPTLEGVGGTSETHPELSICGAEVLDQGKKVRFFIRRGQLTNEKISVGFNIIIKDFKFGENPIITIIDPKVHDSGV